MPLLSENADPLVKSRVLKSNANPDDTDYTKALGPQNHLAGQRYFDPSVNDLAMRQVERDHQGDLNYGLDNLQLPGADYGGDMMAKAIQNKYAGQTDDALSGIRKENEITAKGLRSDEDAKASQELTAVYQKQVQNANEQYAFQRAREKIYNEWNIKRQQAEANLMGQIFGGGSSAAGAA